MPLQLELLRSFVTISLLGVFFAACALSIWPLLVDREIDGEVAAHAHVASCAAPPPPQRPVDPRVAREHQHALLLTDLEALRLFTEAVDDFRARDDDEACALLHQIADGTHDGSQWHGHAVNLASSRFCEGRPR